MNLHEYQGKQLFAEFGLPVSKHEVIFNADEAIQACNKLVEQSGLLKHKFMLEEEVRPAVLN